MTENWVEEQRPRIAAIMSTAGLAVTAWYETDDKDLWQAERYGTAKGLHMALERAGFVDIRAEDDTANDMSYAYATFRLPAEQPPAPVANLDEPVVSDNPRIKIKTLVTPLDEGWDSEFADGLLASYINGGWEVMDITITTHVDTFTDGIGRAVHTRVVTMVRDAISSIAPLHNIVFCEPPTEQSVVSTEE